MIPNAPGRTLGPHATQPGMFVPNSIQAPCRRTWVINNLHDLSNLRSLTTFQSHPASNAPQVDAR